MTETPVTHELLPNAAAILALKIELDAIQSSVRAATYDAPSNRRAAEYGQVERSLAVASEALFNLVNVANVYGECPTAFAAMRAHLAG